MERSSLTGGRRRPSKLTVTMGPSPSVTALQASGPISGWSAADNDRLVPVGFGPVDTDGQRGGLTVGPTFVVEDRQCKIVNGDGLRRRQPLERDSERPRRP